MDRIEDDLAEVINVRVVPYSNDRMVRMWQLHVAAKYLEPCDECASYGLGSSVRFVCFVT